MNYTKLGESGLTISRLVLGCMSYGEPGRGGHGWSLDEDASRPFFRAAVEAGITTFDTANVYSLGSSEVITGRMLREFTTRDQVLIATKLAMPMGQHVAELGGWTPFVSMQDQYNPIMREEEREMHPFCSATGVGVLSYSPLARGRLSRPYGAASERLGLDETGAKLYRQDETSDRAIADVVGTIADERGISRAQVVLAWQFTKPAVSAPIIGATKPNHLSDAVAALEIQLTADEVARIEAPYTPRRPEGFV